jgi:hypothetical protein
MDPTRAGITLYPPKFVAGLLCFACQIICATLNPQHPFRPPPVESEPITPFRRAAGLSAIA